MTCSSVFWEQKREKLKTVSQTFFKLQSIQTQSICGQRHLLVVLEHWGDNIQQFYNTFRILLLKGKRFEDVDTTPNSLDTSTLVYKPEVHKNVHQLK